MKRNTRKLTIALMPLLLLVGTFNSCTKETNGGDGALDDESLKVHITFPKNEQPQVSKARAAKGASGDAEGLTFWTSGTSENATRATDPGTAEEQQIDHMTIFIFNADGSTLESMLNIDLTSANTSLPDEQPQWKSDKTLIVRPIANRNSSKKIYAVANWSQTNFDKATYTEAMLKNALSTIPTVEQLATPLLMSGSNTVNFSTSGSRVTVALERLVAKLAINLTVDAETQEKLSNIEWLTTKARIMVGNVPNKSYVVGRTPAAFPADYMLLTSGSIPMTDVSASGDLKWNSGIYVHENPLTGANIDDKMKTISLIINLPYRNKTTGVEESNNYYKVYLNNRADANPYQVLRNTIYNFNLKIMGLGLPFTDVIPDVNVEEDLIVSPWEYSGFEVGDIVPKYFKISRNRVEFQIDETVCKVTIASDISDWRLVKTDTNTTLFSFAENETDPFTDANLTYTISGTVSEATITITRNSKEPFAPQEMTLVARNIRMPFKVADDNGIIPSYMLVGAITKGDISYNGWPEDKLPPRGLQFAKIGNQLPSGQALVEDLEVPWSTENVGTGVTEVRCGFGKSNTAELLKLDALKYPAVNQCKALGDGWYLPSRDELVWLSVYKGHLGPSYTLRHNGSYWSASQSNNNNAWIVSMYGHPYDSAGNTGGETTVRCVRNI